MAHRTEFAWVGSINDPSYGIDDRGEMFHTIADATAALHARHRNPTDVHPVIRGNGTYEVEPFGTLTDEAFILLWPIDENYQATEALLREWDRQDVGFDPREWMEPRASRVVWVGARQAIRHGSYAEWEQQSARRKRQDVREAGSVVVTDA